jgi:cytochrome c biogenesis protein CcdA
MVYCQNWQRGFRVLTLNNIFSMILLALLDSLNPATIATMMILLPLVKKKWHSLIFIAGTFTVYFSSGFLAFVGVDKYLKTIITETLRKFSLYIGIAELLIASTLIIIGIIQCYVLVRRIIKKDQSQKDYMSAIVKMVNPLALIVLSISSTLMDIPTAIPYFGFIGILSASNTSIMIAIVLFILYCFAYVLPMIILYLIFTLIKGERFNKIETTFRNIINRASEYLLPIMLILIGVLVFGDGLGRI